MNGKEYRVLLDQELEGRTTVAEVIKDLPLYDQILNRGQLMGKLMSRNLIEVVRRQAHEIDKIQASEFREVESHSNTIDQRDHNEEMANKLAAAIAGHFRVEIGEHSSANCPWSEALGVMNGVYVTDSDDERRIKHLFGVITATYQDMQELKPSSAKQMKAYTRITERLLGEMGVAVPS